MAYHGYIPLIHEYTKGFDNPKILEIGVSTGITAFSLIQRLCMTHAAFLYEGVDIEISDSVHLTLTYFNRGQDHNISLVKANSLDFLEKTEQVYDIVLIDGDHNYYTVEKELNYLSKISHNKTLVICDDYHGRWAEKDLFYSERPEYQNNEIATKKIVSDKAGVKNAIDDFLNRNDQWVKFTPIPGEPVVLLHKDHPVVKNNQISVDKKDE